MDRDRLSSVVVAERNLEKCSKEELWQEIQQLKKLVGERDKTINTLNQMIVQLQADNQQQQYVAAVAQQRKVIPVKQIEPDFKIPNGLQKPKKKIPEIILHEEEEQK